MDVVHVHNMPNFLILAALLPLLAGRRTILDVHDTMLETYASKYEGLLRTIMTRVLLVEERICCGLADHIICVNEPQKDALVQRGIDGRKVTISMNVPDPRRFTASSRKPDKAHLNGRFRVAYFGTMSKRLGIDLALRAVASLKHAIPGLELYLMGDGDDLDEFMALSGQAGIQDVTHFSGKMLPFEELLRELEMVDLVIVPNRRNAATELMLPVKLLECVGLGIPAVAPRLRAIQHYFSEDMVFYFEPGDVGSLANSILFAYQNEAERTRRARRARVFLDRYGWETHKQNLLGLYMSS